jgi:hypothetical protein
MALAGFESVILDWSRVYAAKESPGLDRGFPGEVMLYFDFPGQGQFEIRLTRGDAKIAFQKLKADRQRFRVAGLWHFDTGKVCHVLLPREIHGQGTISSVPSVP